MDIFSLMGMLGGLGIVVGVMAHKHLLSHLWDMEAFILVIGGAATCAMFSYPAPLLKRALSAVKLVYVPKLFVPEVTIDLLVEIAQKARRGGILAIEKDMKETKDPFLKVALKMIIDNINSHVIKETLENEIHFMHMRHKSVSGFWNTMAGFAPTFGLIGTVLGLIIVLSDLSDIGRLGASMAAAIIATFYGLYFANFLFGPIAMKLNAHNDSEVVFKHAIIEGVLSIAAGEVPYVTRTKLEAFLDNQTKMRGEAKKAANTEVGAGTPAPAAA